MVGRVNSKNQQSIGGHCWAWPGMPISKGVQYWALDVCSVRKQEFLMEKISYISHKIDCVYQNCRVSNPICFDKFLGILWRFLQKKYIPLPHSTVIKGYFPAHLSRWQDLGNFRTYDDSSSAYYQYIINFSNKTPL